MGLDIEKQLAAKKAARQQNSLTPQFKTKALKRSSSRGNINEKSSDNNEASQSPMFKLKPLKRTSKSNDDPKKDNNSPAIAFKLKKTGSSKILTERHSNSAPTSPNFKKL